MAADTLSDFGRHYLETWTEPDPERRRAHIARVHEQNIAERGLRFVYDQHAEAADALLLRWSMLAPDGSAVGRGVDVVFRDAEGLIPTVYMFMGIN